MDGTKQNNDTENRTSEEPSESEANSASESEEGGEDATDSYEEECVICLEELSSQPWGRCTPCNHAFHTKCWWDWENAHNERVGRRQGGNRAGDEGPKCCLCNTVNKQFVDGTGEPAHNPSPFVASEDPGGEGGNRFTNWFREVGEEASGFMEFLASDLRESRGSFPFNRSQSSSQRNTNAELGRGVSPHRTSSEGLNRGRRTSFVPPIFGSRSNFDRRRSSSSANSRPNRDRATPPFAMPPLFRNLSNQQRPWASSWSSSPNRNSNANPFNQIRPGTQIVTQHLVSSPRLNGRHGTIMQYQPQSGRYLVQLEADISTFIVGDSTAPMAIKPENLLQTGVKVKIHGLQSEPRLNGKEGTICAYSKDRNRYVVQITSLLAPIREISIQPTNIRIGNGMCVRLEGLQRTPQWNGKYGTIVGWVEDQSGTSGSGRYEVRLSRQYAVRVKMENVRV
mmetsp:Transcript_13260/g.28654  ORF Transcript_13260/g.28654 Transcript_13260/m.28654 type:complete len:452 (+) Transcript_13260:52-1407(+)